MCDSFEKEKAKQYLSIMIELNRLHGEIFGTERSLVTPACFSECICKHFLNLRNYKNRDFDAEDNDKKTYEIKATSSCEGTTTISDKESDYLVWIFFNYKDKQLVIKKSEFSKIKEKMKNKGESNEKNKGEEVHENDTIDDENNNISNSGRKTIMLSKVFTDDDIVKRISMETLEVIKADGKDDSCGTVAGG